MKLSEMPPPRAHASGNECRSYGAARGSAMPSRQDGPGTGRSCQSSRWPLGFPSPLRGWRHPVAGLEVAAGPGGGQVSGWAPPPGAGPGGAPPAVERTIVEPGPPPRRPGGEGAAGGGGGRPPPARRGGPGGGGAGRCGAVRSGPGARCARQAQSAAARAEGGGEES